MNKIAGVPTTNYGEGTFPSNNASLSVQLDIFVDGMVVEVFVNDGEHAITQLQPGAKLFTTLLSVDAAGVAAAAMDTPKEPGSAGSATFSVLAWAMQPSITGT